MKVHSNFFHKRFLYLFALALFFTAMPMPACAQSVQDRLAEQQAMPVESNEIEGWPQGPVVSAEAAILMEMGTGTVLYAKNIHLPEYPASCTKILTCLIAAERCSMDETVVMSHDAVYDTPLDSSYISLDVGNEITMEQALNAILICSANNVAFAVAEHITGTDWESFGDIMNERAAELGCVDSHFVNPNGLPDDDHYTSAYDLARIGRVYFDNEMLCKISRTTRLHLAPTETQPKDIYENTKNRLLPGQSMAYEYLLGSKTGYTNKARNCLVSGAEKDGMKLVCVVLKDESPKQFEDTVALFDYGFENFKKVNVSQSETRYNINTADNLYSDHDIFGSSQSLLELNRSDYVVLPVTADFADTQSSISYDTEAENQAALITYDYHGVTVGCASVDFISRNTEDSFFTPSPEDGEEGALSGNTGEGDTPSENPGEKNTLSENTGEENTPGITPGAEETSGDGTTSGNGAEENSVKKILSELKEAFILTGIAVVLLSIILTIIHFLRKRMRPSDELVYSPRPLRRDPSPSLKESETLRQKRQAAARAAARRARRRRNAARRAGKFKDLD